MRGEDVGEFDEVSQLAGSPPHARGRRPGVWALAFAGRITPACAGKTTCSARPTISISDHPRMRGEDDSYGETMSMSPGSPPHARGRR